MKSQIKAGVVLNYVILGLNALTGLLYTPYMLRMLGQSEYGLYSIAGSVIAYLGLLDFGFGDATIRYTAKFRAENKVKEQYSLFGMLTLLYLTIGLVTLVAGLIVYCNVDRIFESTLNAEELHEAKILILIMVMNLAVSFPLGIYGGIITAYEDFIFLRIVSIARIILSTAVMVTILYFGYKAIGLVIVQTAFNLVTLLINFFYCRYKIKVRISFAKLEFGFLREVTVFSFWCAVGILTDRLYWSTGQFVLGAVSGTIQVSIFALSIALQSIYMSCSMAVSSVLLPRITAIVARGDDYRLISDIFIRTGRIQFAILSVILSGFIVFGKPFISLWSGGGYNDTYYICLMFFVVLTVPLVQNVGLAILKARNKMRFRSLSYILLAGMSIALQIPLSKTFGAMGCAVGVSLAMILGQWFVMNIYYQKSQKINIVRFWKEIIKMYVVPALFTALCCVLTRFVNLYEIKNLILYMIVFGVLYCWVMYQSGLNSTEKEMVKAPLRRVFAR